MEVKTVPLKIGSSYSKFRTGKAFFISLSLFVAIWLIWNHTPGFPHFDGDNSLLNVILSIEASIATSMILMASETQDEMQRKQLVYMLHILEATKNLITHDSAQIDNIESLLKTIVEKESTASISHAPNQETKDE
ncbi:MAG: DUF1003 domain-containing protein [Rhodospirillales bacterium]|nr:DUF1003 domain-containing protein [Rhodospirillales bacterium]